jgi:hypothetical protein
LALDAQQFGACTPAIGATSLAHLIGTPVKSLPRLMADGLWAQCDQPNPPSGLYGLTTKDDQYTVRPSQGTQIGPRQDQSSAAKGKKGSSPDWVRSRAAHGLYVCRYSFGHALLMTKRASFVITTSGEGLAEQSVLCRMTLFIRRIPVHRIDLIGSVVEKSKMAQ